MAIVLMLILSTATWVFVSEKSAAERFKQVGAGMTREEVHAIMGPPTTPTDWVYAVWAEGGREFVVWFDGDWVIEKQEQNKGSHHVAKE